MAAPPAPQSAQPAPAQPSPVTTLADEWDEAQLVASLARIEALQNQLNALRTILPTLLKSTYGYQRQQHRSRVAYFSAFEKTVRDSAKQLDEFKTAWVARETQEMLQKAAARRGVDGDMGAARGVERYGWGGERGGKEEK